MTARGGGTGGGAGTGSPLRRTTTTINTNNTSFNNNNNNSNGPLTSKSGPASLRLVSGAVDGTVCFFDVIPSYGGGGSMTSNNITTMTDALKPPPQQSQQSLLPPVRGGVDGLRDYRNDFVVGGGGGGGGGGCAVVRIEMMHYHIGIALVVLQVTDKYANTYVDTYIVLPPTHILLYSQHISPSHPPAPAPLSLVTVLPGWAQ